MFLGLDCSILWNLFWFFFRALSQTIKWMLMAEKWRIIGQQPREWVACPYSNFSSNEIDLIYLLVDTEKFFPLLAFCNISLVTCSCSIFVRELWFPDAGRHQVLGFTEGVRQRQYPNASDEKDSGQVHQQPGLWAQSDQERVVCVWGSL